MFSTSAPAFFDPGWIPATVDPDIPTSIAGADVAISSWTAWHLGFPADAFDPCTAMGVVYRGALICGVVFYGFRNYRDMGGGALIESGIYASSPRWFTRRVAHDICRYVYEQLGVTRWQVSCAKNNKRARSFVERAGWRYEGMARRGFDGKRNAAVYAMLPEDCPWLGK